MATRPPLNDGVVQATWAAASDAYPGIQACHVEKAVGAPPVMVPHCREVE